MASMTLQVGDRVPAGNSVSAYPASNWLPHELPPTGAPKGTAASSSTVAADGTVTLTNVNNDQDYFAEATGHSGSRVYIRFRPTSAKTATEITANPGHLSRVSGGRFYVASTGRITVAAAGNVRVTIANPAGSGKNVSILRLAGLSTVMGWATAFINPTTGVPASAVRPLLNAIVGGGVAGSMEVRGDTDAVTALSGGTDTGVTLTFPANARLDVDLPPLVLRPGFTFGMNVALTQAADMAISVYGYEDVIGA